MRENLSQAIAAIAKAEGARYAAIKAIIMSSQPVIGWDMINGKR